MDTERICPSCQKPLAPGVPLGLCPECLIKSGFPTGVESADAKQPPFIPPTVEELAKLFPQLEILELIGKGGMGAVYKARQPRLNRFVALKILPPGIGSDPAFAERFAREAQALAQLNHPGIVILYEFGQAGGLHFFMMEFVDGVNLRQLLINGRIAPREALAIVPQICDALQFAHDQGIVHRDIKPENILLDRRGHVKIADFGLAKIIGGENEPVRGTSPSGVTTLTETGKIIGTPQYMSPEQIAHPADVDHRADIYALGVVFYQMLTGELPGKKLEPPSKKVHIDVRLDEVVLRALENNPELRFQQVSEVKTCVDTIVGNSGRESAETESEGNQSSRSQPKSAPTNQKPRFSPMAILGAVCVWFSFVPLFLFSIPFMIFLMGFSERGITGRPNEWVRIVGMTMFFLALILIVPTVTTLLGWVAVSQIRRSAGKLYGMWLAVFNGLLYPLLALDAVVFGLFYLIVRLVAKLPYFASSGDGSFGGGIGVGYQIALLFLMWLGVATLLSVVADFLIIRRVWRAMNKPDTANSITLNAVESWLAVMDGGNYAQSWDSAAQYFQKAVSKAEWIERLQSARQPQGKVVSRKLRRAYRFGSRFVVKFDTAFAGLKAAVETVTFSRESDGQWRAIGYLILPADAERAQLGWLGKQALFYAGLSGVLGILTICLSPNPPAFLVWSILAAASLGIILGICARRNTFGKRAIKVGSVNAAIWLAIFVVTSFRQGTTFYIGQTSFPKGDSIVITSVRRTKEQMVVKGHYNLVSTDSAQLALYITSPSNTFGPTDPKQWMQISKGQGDFKLTHTHLVPGLPHVTMYTMDATGKPFAGVYFGNKGEALEENKLDLGYYQSNGIVAAAQTLQSNIRDISSPPSPFRDTAKYLSPFTRVHFDTNDINKVVVTYDGSEYELAAIDDLPVADILDFCRRQYGQPPFGEGWAQKRFAEDLVIVLSEMKHPVSSDNTVSLTLVDPQTGQQKIIAHAPMTGENRAAIFQDRTLDNSNLLQSLPQK